MKHQSYLTVHTQFVKSQGSRPRFSGGAVIKYLPAIPSDKRDAGSIPGLGRFLEEGNGNP